LLGAAAVNPGWGGTGKGRVELERARPPALPPLRLFVGVSGGSGDTRKGSPRKTFARAAEGLRDG